MAFRSSAVTINSSTPTAIIQAQAGDVEAAIGVDGLGVEIYVGGSTVSTSTGFPVTGNQFNNGGPLWLRVRPGDELWAIAVSGSPTVQVLIRSA
jgi:hypothetical protein